MVYVCDFNIGAGNSDIDGVLTDAERARMLTFGLDKGFIEPPEPGRAGIPFPIFVEITDG